MVLRRSGPGSARVWFHAALLTAALASWPLAGTADGTAPPVPCKDRTGSPHGDRDACSGHGGIAKTATATPSDGGSGGTASATQSTTTANGSPVRCKDGTTATHGGRGACTGHGGVDAAATATNSGPGGTTSTLPATRGGAASEAPSPKLAPPKPATAPGAGGAPGLVWVDTASKVYHCQGDRWYGTTEQGKYMSEANAKAQGVRPDHNKPCG